MQFFVLLKCTMIYISHSRPIIYIIAHRHHFRLLVHQPIAFMEQNPVKPWLKIFRKIEAVNMVIHADKRFLHRIRAAFGLLFVTAMPPLRRIPHINDKARQTPSHPLLNSLDDFLSHLPTSSALFSLYIPRFVFDNKILIHSV
jgi:hypothetical protein